MLSKNVCKQLRKTVKPTDVQYIPQKNRCLAPPVWLQCAKGVSLAYVWQDGDLWIVKTQMAV